MGIPIKRESLQETELITFIYDFNTAIPYGTQKRPVLTLFREKIAFFRDKKLYISASNPLPFAIILDLPTRTARKVI